MFLLKILATWSNRRLWGFAVMCMKASSKRWEVEFSKNTARRDGALVRRLSTVYV